MAEEPADFILRRIHEETQLLADLTSKLADLIARLERLLEEGFDVEVAIRRRRR